MQLTVETQNGLRYVVSRSCDEEPMVLTADGSPTDLSLKSSGFFRAHIYSQNELESIAERAEDQLRLLDSLASDEIDTINKQISDTRTQLHTIAANASPLLASTDTLNEELALLGY